MACPPPKNDLFYFDSNGLMVMTEKYHLQRGFCCQSDCRHCPYGYKRLKQEEEKKKKDNAE
ncbi:MAG: DUF5522 domain-containing protein [Chitinophagales bacterium]